MNGRKRSNSQLPLYPSPILEGIMKGLPPEKAAKLKESGLLPDIAAALNGMQESLLLEAVKHMAGKRNSSIAVILGGAESRVDTLLSFKNKPDEKELVMALKKRRVMPATLKDIFAFAVEHPDLPRRFGPIVSTEPVLIDGHKFTGCISQKASNDPGLDASWIASAPHGAYFAASSE